MNTAMSLNAAQLAVNRLSRMNVIVDAVKASNTRPIICIKNPLQKWRDVAVEILETIQGRKFRTYVLLWNGVYLKWRDAV
ncbi:hypothetical protein ACPV36_05075 [Photobacterium damselae]|uniref:hypothetical protein n=1 Tax=Photobacterium damselae TaxID=38293 RepID=UPI004067E440